MGDAECARSCSWSTRRTGLAAHCGTAAGECREGLGPGGGSGRGARQSARAGDCGDTGVHPATAAIGLFFALGLIREVALVADLLDLMELRFEPVDVLFFIFQQEREQLARGIVTGVA